MYKLILYFNLLVLRHSFEDALHLRMHFLNVPYPFTLNISTHILHTVLFKFSVVMTWRICVTIRGYLNW